jgi:hypothetical protein
MDRLWNRRWSHGGYCWLRVGDHETLTAAICSSGVECGSRAPALTRRSHASPMLCPKHGLGQPKRQHGWRTPKVRFCAQISDVSQGRFSRSTKPAMSGFVSRTDYANDERLASLLDNLRTLETHGVGVTAEVSENGDLSPVGGLRASRAPAFHGRGPPSHVY